MRAVVTRVTSASVRIDGETVGKIGAGFLVLLGVHQDDTEQEALKIADKICGLRVFEDENGKMNVNPADAGAEILVISQFTLFADCKSRRPALRARCGGVPQARLPCGDRRLCRRYEGRIRQRRARDHPA